jgi:hypothetical protein
MYARSAGRSSAKRPRLSFRGRPGRTRRQGGEEERVCGKKVHRGNESRNDADFPRGQGLNFTRSSSFRLDFECLRIAVSLIVDGFCQLVNRSGNMRTVLCIEHGILH